MKPYIACESFDFLWSRDDVAEFDAEWRGGNRDLEDLAKLFRRKPEEIAFLVIDRAHKGFIGPGGKAARGGRTRGAKDQKKRKRRGV